MANPVRKLDRTRRDARRFAADARDLAVRGRRRLAAQVQADVAAACDEVDAAADDGDATRLSRALRDLDALWAEHLERLGKPAWREYLEAVAAAALAALLLRAAVVDGYRMPSGAMAPTLLAGEQVLVSRLAYGIRVPFTRLRLWGEPPRRGDVVLFERPGDRGHDLVERVVGLPGDVVEVRDEVLYVNGVPQPRTPDGELSRAERDGEGGRPFPASCRRFREALARGAIAGGSADDAGQVEARWQAAAAEGVANHGVLQCAPGPLAGRAGPFPAVAPGHVLVLGDDRDRSADGRGGGAWQVPLDRIEGRVARIYFSWGTGGAPFGRGPRLDRLLRRVE